MNGEPLTICLVNLWNAGIRNFDIKTAYDLMWKQAQIGATGERVGVYQGFAEEQKGITLNPDASVSTALEYNVAFAALGNLAHDLGKPDDARYLWGRALQYRQMYNPVSGYLQSRTETGVWNQNFDDYTEGNRDIYLWLVPHDVQGLVDLMSGPSSFDRRLDEFFEKNLYDPTNEPDIQAPFLYDYINRPWKTQRIVAQTADRVFTDAPGGLAGGNDDLGTMSSWYILSQLGFYPVDPGVPYLEVCTPRFTRATIHLEAPHAGKTFVIEAPDAAPDAIYIQGATLNGQPLDKPWFAQSAMTKGGTWNVQVGAQPNQNWGASPFDRPPSLSTGLVHLPQNPIVKSYDAPGREISWRYTLEKPADNWMQTDFNDANWKSGPGGFGTEDVGVTPRTPWTSDDIWMRRTVTLPADFKAPMIVAYHDQDIEIYLNGVLAAKVASWTHAYDPISIAPAAAATLHAGANVMAIHVRHPGDGRHFADAFLGEVKWPENER